jgi:cytochrome c-type biogenesis protein CcsB
MAISNLLLIILLLVRWDKSGHFPLSNLYESLMFLAWCCTFLYLIYSTSFTIAVEKIFGSIIAPCALLMNAFATFSLPKEMQDSAPLVPALQSNWLMMHVTVMIISYATLIIGSLLSILFLILNMISADSHIINRLTTNNVSLTKFTWLFFGSNNTESAEKNAGLMVLLLKLDSLSYRILGLGFPFLTIGILSGAVWANEAWGSYWSWDPKETWALLTWLVFAIYLHTRLTKGWEGKKPAVIASIGFLVVWFCYLGVNLIGEGLHSYGFFN